MPQWNMLGAKPLITWTNAGLLSIRTWETNFSEILIKMQTFYFKEMHIVGKLAAIFSPPQCVNSLRPSDTYMRQ